MNIRLKESEKYTSFYDVYFNDRLLGLYGLQGNSLVTLSGMKVDWFPQKFEFELKKLLACRDESK